MWRIRFLLPLLASLLMVVLGIFSLTGRTVWASSAPGGACVAAPTNLAAWYSMDETSGSTMTDLRGAYNGTYFNNPAVNVGQYVLNSRKYDGVNQYGETSSGPNFGTGDFSIDAWVNLTATGLQVIVDKRSTAPVGYALMVANGTLALQIADGTGQPSLYVMSGSPGINDGQWHFVAASVQRVGQVRVTLIADSIVQNFGNAPLGSLDNTSGVRIARNWPNALDPADRYYSGSIDEVELFSRALSEAELGNIRNATTFGKCRDSATATSTITGVPTDTPTASMTPVNTNTPTYTASATATCPQGQLCGTSTPTASASATGTPTATATATQGGAFTATRTRTALPPNAPTKTPTPTATGSPATAVPTPENCYSYGITIGTGTIVPAGTLVPGSNCDDCDVELDIENMGFYFPFYDLYEHLPMSGEAPDGPPIMRKLRMSPNGELGFSNDAPSTPSPTVLVEANSKAGPDAPGINTCLPAPGKSYTIFPHWDDVRTDCEGCGIFYDVSGTTGSRILDLEWRGNYYLCGGYVNFEVRLYESTGEFDVIYGRIDQLGSGATTGVQRDNDNYTQFSCNTMGALTPGMMLHFTRQGCPSATPTMTASPTGTRPTATSTLTPVVACVQTTPTATVCPVQFTDVPQGSTFYTYIRCLACRGIVNGYPDGTFKPQNNVTRGQLAKIVSNSAGMMDPAGTQIFEDVPPGSTFYDFVQRLASRGYIGGYQCGGPGEPCVAPGNRPYFRPGNNATRGQISKIVANAAGFTEPAGAQVFEDVVPGSTFYDFVERLASRGYIEGYACGGPGEPCVAPGNRPYFRPNSNATRGQTSKIVSNSFFPGCATPFR